MPEELGAGWEEIVLCSTQPVCPLASSAAQPGSTEGNTSYEHGMCFGRASVLFPWGVHELAAVVKQVHTWSSSSILVLARWKPVSVFHECSVM